MPRASGDSAGTPPGLSVMDTAETRPSAKASPAIFRTLSIFCPLGLVAGNQLEGGYKSAGTHEIVFEYAKHAMPFL